ncbi:MAG: hypothetical protein AB1733_24440 [Thermodesulfobacteriota bacterium]
MTGQTDKEKYRKLNPFLQSSVGENVIWGADANDFCDVESINEHAFKALIHDIESVDGDQKTRARFLVGAAGSGKSHLFARLRRRLTKGQFAFVANPPTAIPHIKRFILKKVVFGMARPVMGSLGFLEYSQLQRTVYTLMQRILTPKGLDTGRIHRFWKTVKRADYEKFEARFVKYVSRVGPLEIPIHLRRVLFRVLDDERRDLAAAWLSGIETLRESDYQSLGVTGPLKDDEVSEVLNQLGHLSVGVGPIILILDQLDSLLRPDQVREIESLMIDLNDSSRNWYVIVSLVQPRYDFWLSILSDPFKQRFGTFRNASYMLQTVELSALSKEHRRQLIEARLAAEALQTQRAADGITDPYYPLSSSTFQEVISSDVSTARMLIQKALDAYYASITDGIPPPTRSLADFVDQLLAAISVELREEDLAVDTASIADRIEELLTLLLIANKGSTPKRSDGPLHTEVNNFQGVDRIYTCGEREVRVVCYDVQQTSKFPSILKKLVNAAPNTILVRDGRVSVSGKATKQNLTIFQKDKKFFHLSLDQIRNLHALGNLLAKMREGEFENESTEPKPTERTVYECLAEKRDLVGTDLAQTLLAMIGLAEPPDKDPPGPGGQGTSEWKSTFPADDPVVLGIARLMEAERWMSFERLCVRVNAQGVNAHPQQVYERLQGIPICDSVTIYPSHASLLEGIGIVVWHTEE